MGVSDLLTSDDAVVGDKAVHRGIAEIRADLLGKGRVRVLARLLQCVCVYVCVCWGGVGGAGQGGIGCGPRGCM